MSDVIVIDDSDDDSPTNSVHESVPSVPESLPVPVTTPTSLLKNNNKKIADLLKQAFKLALEKETNDATQNDTKVAKPDVGNIRLKPIETITAPKFNKDKEDIVPELRYYKQNKSDVATSNTVVKEEIIKIEEHDVKQELMVQNAACTGNITVVNNTPGGVIIMNNGNNQEFLLRNSAGTYSNVQATIAPSTSTQTLTNNPPNNPILIQLNDGNYGLAFPVQQCCKFCEYTTNKLVDLEVHVAAKHHTIAIKTDKMLPKLQHLHKCPICSKINSSMKRLKNHFIDYHSNEPKHLFGEIWSRFGEVTIKDNDNLVGYSCPYCRFIGKYPSDLRYHCATSHDEFHEEKVLRCLYCYYETEKHIHLSKHVRKHCKEETLVCLYCNFKTNTSKNLCLHFCMMHPRLRDGSIRNPKNMNKIPNQNSVDDSETTLAKSNTSENWVPNNDIVEFKLTNVETARKPDVAKGTSLTAIPDQIAQKYASVSMKIMAITEFPKRPLLCPYCLVFRYNLTDLNTHIQDRHLSCVFLCILCKFKVDAYTELEVHESKKHPELFGCSFCWFRTFSYQEYNAHISVHYKNNNFVCVDCDFKCLSYQFEKSKKHVLTEHLTRRLRFNKDETLLFTHKETSNAKSKNCCNFCGFRETQTTAIPMQIHLLMHFKSDRASGSITCTDCNFSIRVNDIINKHLDEEHPGHQCKPLLKKYLLLGLVNCPYCRYVCSINRLWICHVNSEHPDNALSQWTVCFICKVTIFRSFGQMSRHFQNNHMGYFQRSPAIRSRYECAECNTTASLYWDHYFCGYIVCDHVGKRLQEEEEDPHFTRKFLLMKYFKQVLNSSRLPKKFLGDNNFFVHIVSNKSYYMEPIENLTQPKAIKDSNDLNESAPTTAHKKANVTSLLELPCTKTLRLNCPHCEKSFLALLLLSEHVRTTHNTSDLYHCISCNFTNKEPNAVENHEADHTAFEKCIYCFYRCQKNPNSNKMDNHISNNHINKDLKKLRCVYCSYKVVPKEHQKLRQHFLRKHYTACGIFFDAGRHRKYIRENRVNKCNLCDFTIKDSATKELAQFKVHLSVHFPLNDGIIHCAYCPRFTTDLEHYMHEHLKNEHKVLIKTATNTCNPKDLTQCRLCNFMTTKENIKNHEEMYHKDMDLEEPLRTTELSQDQRVVDLKVSQIETDSVKKTTLGGNASPVILNTSLSKAINDNTFFSWTDTSNTCEVLTLNEKSNDFNTTSIDTNNADKETQPNGAKSRRKQLFSELEDDYHFFTDGSTSEDVSVNPLLICQQESPPLSCISEIVNDNTLGFKITNVETVVEPSTKTSEETKSSVTQNIISDWDDDFDATAIITEGSTKIPEPASNKRKLNEDNSQSSENTAEPFTTTSELSEVTSEPLEVSNKKRIVNTYYNKKKRKIGSTPPLVEFGNVIPFVNLASEERNNINEDEDDWNLVVMDGNDNERIDSNDQLEDDTVILNSTDF